MDLIYIILSIYLRLFPTVLPLSRVRSGQTDRRFQSGRPLAMWIPVVGWVSVTVHYLPNAVWLAWRVTSVERLRGGPPSRRKRTWLDHSSDRDQNTDPRSDRSEDAR